MIVHGGPDPGELRALGVDASRVLDVSVNTNPYGPSPDVLAAIAGAVVDRYPDPTARATREQLARHLDVSPDAIALGNGAADLLWTLVRAIPRGGRPALIVEPTFGEPRAALAAAGAAIATWTASAADGYAVDLVAVARAVHAADAALVYLCTPNTPTGVGVPAPAIAAWAADLPRATILVDQSFLSLSDRADDARVAMPANVVRVRSLTKDHAIPGVRIGYLLATPAIVALVDAHRPAWMTGAHAQAAAVAALRASAFVADSARRLLADRAALDVGLRTLGLYPVPSSTGFVLVPIPDVAGVRRRLLREHHVLIRDCASFGLHDHARIAARRAADQARVITALAEEIRRAQGPCGDLPGGAADSRPRSVR